MAGPDDTEPEDPNLGLLLFIPYRALEARVLAALEEQGHPMPLSQARVFQRIAPRGSRLVELAEASQLSKQTVGSVVDQLERAGYVERVRDPTDARAKLVRVTALGGTLVQLTRPVVEQVEAEWSAHLGPTRVRQLREALTALREITDPFADRVRGAAERNGRAGPDPVPGRTAP